MNEFIHTFSFVTYISKENFLDLKNTYGNNFFFESKESKYVLSEYSARGVRAEVKFSDPDVRKYNKDTEEYKMEIIVTLSKLIYPSEKMKKLYSPDEIYMACKNLKSIMMDIYDKTEIYLCDKLKIYRVDVTKDAKTPSNEYSLEIIRLAKKAVVKNGYNIWNPADNVKWSEENSLLYNNKSVNVNAKVYNKLVDLKQSDDILPDEKGLIRFEVSLLRNNLKDRGYIGDKYQELDSLYTVLCNILRDASVLMNDYMIIPLRCGQMLSKGLQKKYIKFQCQDKKKRIENMIAYRDWINSADNYKLLWKNRNKTDSVVKNFKKYDLSPIYTSKEFPYIPSFKEILNEEFDEQFLRFAKSKNKGNEYKYWELE